ncbi:hypothetical protein EXIGLDRAFT_833414 [Exidia glandulosa HHB12029]|uniref:Uncharacterized protein n=1 Tax=Exidia glandulosa HHB12029 TaxID=1314781 RepID=A0A165KQM6_EXIGL|nr:hypothetical protein EXIGLDRAFT_833414 [Exidia glandulosa HHB12029]
MRFISLPVLSLAVAMGSFVAASALKARDDPALPESATLFVKNAAGTAVAFGTNDGRFLALPNAQEDTLIQPYEVTKILTNDPSIGLRATLGFGGTHAGVCTRTFPDFLLLCGADRIPDPEFDSQFVFSPVFENGEWNYVTELGITLANIGPWLRLHMIGDNETSLMLTSSSSSLARCPSSEVF